MCESQHYFHYFRYFTSCVRSNTFFALYAISQLVSEATLFLLFSLFHYLCPRQHFFLYFRYFTMAVNQWRVLSLNNNWNTCKLSTMKASNLLVMMVAFKLYILPLIRVCTCMRSEYQFLSFSHALPCPTCIYTIYPRTIYLFNPSKWETIILGCITLPRGQGRL